MLRLMQAAMVFSGTLLAGSFFGAPPAVAPVHADALSGASDPAYASEMRAPIDPKKKKAGEACKSASECQKHQTCEKDGDKEVCKEPPRPSLPPGTAT